MYWESRKGNCITLSRFYTGTWFKCLNTIDKMNSGIKKDVLSSANMKRSEGEDNSSQSSSTGLPRLMNEKETPDEPAIRHNGISRNSAKQHEQSLKNVNSSSSFTFGNPNKDVNDDEDASSGSSDGERAEKENNVSASASSVMEDSCFCGELNQGETRIPYCMLDQKKAKPLNPVPRRKHKELANNLNEPQAHLESRGSLTRLTKEKNAFSSSKGEYEESMYVESISSDGETTPDSVNGWKDGIPAFPSSTGENESTESILSDSGAEWKDGIPIAHEKSPSTDSTLSNGDSVTGWKNGVPIFPSLVAEHAMALSASSSFVLSPHGEHEKSSSAEGILTDREKTPDVVTGRKYKILKLPLSIGEPEIPLSTENVVLDGEELLDVGNGRNDGIPTYSSASAEHEASSSIENVLSDGEGTPDGVTGWRDGIPVFPSPSLSSTEIIPSDGETTPDSITGWKYGIPVVPSPRSSSTEIMSSDREETPERLSGWKDGIPFFPSSKQKHKAPLSTKAIPLSAEKTPDIVIGRKHGMPLSALSREKHEIALSTEGVLSVGETALYITTGPKKGLPIFPSPKRKHKLSDGEKSPDSATGWKDGIPIFPTFETDNGESESTTSIQSMDEEETPKNTGWKNGIPVFPSLSTISEESFAEDYLDRSPDEPPGDFRGQQTETPVSEGVHEASVSDERKAIPATSASQKIYEGSLSTPSKHLTVGLQTSENVTRWKATSVAPVELVEYETSQSIEIDEILAEEKVLRVTKEPSFHQHGDVAPSTVSKKHSSEATFDSFSGWKDGVPAFPSLEGSEESVSIDSEELSEELSSEISNGWKDGIPVVISVEEHKELSGTEETLTAQEKRSSAPRLPTEKGEVFLPEVRKELPRRKETPTDSTVILAAGGRPLKDLMFEMEGTEEEHLLHALDEHYKPKLRKGPRNYAVYLVIADMNEEPEEAIEEQDKEPTEVENTLSTMNVKVLKWSEDGTPEIIQITPKPTPGSVPLNRVVERQTIIQGTRPMRVSVARLVPVDEPSDVPPEKQEEPPPPPVKILGGIKNISKGYLATETEQEQATDEDGEQLKLSESLIEILQESIQVVKISPIDSPVQDATDSRIKDGPLDAEAGVVAAKRKTEEEEVIKTTELSNVQSEEEYLDCEVCPCGSCSGEGAMCGACNPKQEDICKTKNMEDSDFVSGKSEEKLPDEGKLDCDKCEQCICSPCTCSECVHMGSSRDAATQTGAVYLISEEEETLGDKNYILQVLSNAAFVLEVSASVTDAEQDTPAKTAVISIRPVMVGQLIPHRCTPSEEEVGEVTLDPVSTTPVSFEVLLDENGKLQEPLSQLQEMLSTELLHQDTVGRETIHQWSASMPNINQTCESIVQGLLYALPEILAARGLCNIEDINMPTDDDDDSRRQGSVSPDKGLYLHKTDSSVLIIISPVSSTEQHHSRANKTSSAMTAESEEHDAETGRAGQDVSDASKLGNILEPKESVEETYHVASTVIQDDIIPSLLRKAVESIAEPGQEDAVKQEEPSPEIAAGGQPQDESKETKHQSEIASQRQVNNGHYMDEEGDVFYDALDYVCT